ncbi:MAG: ABC transporter ATP-binding protein [Anaerolineae bacterium]
MAHLEILNLTKRFGPVTAVNDLSLEIAHGEFLVLLGPNGAGKTTTLRCVAGLEKPDAGQVKFDGQLMNDVSPAERNVAFVFQDYALYPRKTVFQNMAFPLEARRLSKSEIESRVREIAALLHIEQLLDRRPAQLSGGEQQRVALGRAMVRQARAFLMDEPLTNLDFKLRVEMRTELKRLHQEFHTTLFYVTNEQTEAMTMADRVAVLNEGCLQQVGSPREVYDHPVNRFVAGFIGFPRMNFLDCTLTTEGTAQLCSLDSDWAIPVPDRVRDAIREAGREQVILGIRPEDVALKLEAGPASLAGKVFVLEPLGDRTIVDVQLGEETVKVKAPPLIKLEVGQPVWLTLDLDRLHVFERETERALL